MATVNDPGGLAGEALRRLQRERALVDSADAVSRRRIDRLVDDGSLLELAPLARSQQPGAAGETPRDGVVAGWATIGGREVGVLAEDPVVLARTDGQVAANKRLRVLNTCAIRGNPVVYLADGPDRYAPFPPATGDLFGYVSRQWPEPEREALAAPSVTVAFGRCQGRSLEIALASDVVVAVSGAPGGEREDRRDGVPADAEVADEASALAVVRAVVSGLPRSADGPLAPVAPARAPSRPLTDDLLPHPPLGTVVAGLFDAGSVAPFRRADGFVSGLAALEGFPVLFAAAGGERPRLLDAADVRAVARVARLSRRLRVPLLLVQDTDGYDPAAAGPELAKELGTALAELRATPAPKLCLVTGHGHVLGTFVMGGRQLGTDFVCALPSARVAALDVTSYQPGALPDDQDGPWLAAGLGHLDEVVAPSEARRELATIVALTAQGRALPPPEAERAGRYVDDIPKV